MFNVNFAKIHFNQENTPVSEQFDDVYFSNQDGLAESQYVFQQGNQLWERWQQHSQPHFVIAETGFGTGLNFFAAMCLFREFRQRFPQAILKRLFFISFEKYPLRLSQLQQAHSVYPQFADLSQQLQQHWGEPIRGCYPIHFSETRLDLWFGDVADNLPQLGDYMKNKVDAWFLDGFAPSKNPEMWNDDLYQKMYLFTKPNGTFATFTAASAVRKGLEKAGFEVIKRKGYGKKRECIAGKKTEQNPTALSPQNLSATPYYLPQAAKMTQQNIAIIGGGVSSLFSAISLLERGAKVTLYCEDEQLALNASGNKQGAFYPQLSDDDERNVRFYVHAFTYGLQRLKWAEEQQIEFEHDYCGVALCAYDEKSAVKLGKIAQYGWHHSLYQLLNADEMSEKVGLPLSCGGGFIPQGAWLSPRQFVQNAFAHLEKLGLCIKTSQKITALEEVQTTQELQTAEPDQPPSWTVINQHNERFNHEVVILANGHQITEFEQIQKLPLYPVRGQVSQIPTGENLLKLKSVLCYDGYITPVDQQKTSHCIGASHVRDCADKTFNLVEQEENKAKLQKNLPEPWTQEVDVSANQARIGIRCAVRDRIPMLGNVPNFHKQQANYANLFNLRRRKQPIPAAENYPNLYLMAALGSRGLTSAPLLGEMLASMIYDEPIPLSEDILHCLSVNRGWIRKWLKGSVVH